MASRVHLKWRPDFKRRWRMLALATAANKEHENGRRPRFRRLHSNSGRRIMQREFVTPCSHERSAAGLPSNCRIGAVEGPRNAPDPALRRFSVPELPRGQLKI